jgi:predicted O-linked N-acetylglucosamine transferase (SPINDLY family)
MDCIAKSTAEYVDISVKLGTDSDFRNNVRERIWDSRHQVWEEMQVVREFERFFESVAADWSW